MTDQFSWNEFVVSNGGGLLQSWQWGEFYQALGRKIWRVSGIGFGGLVLRFALPLGRNYLYCPRGPIAKDGRAVDDFLEQTKQIARQEGSIFLKWEPEHAGGLTSYMGIKTERRIQPKETIVLDLGQTEREILAQMHYKTRYNIRLSPKKGVEALTGAQAKAMFGQEPAELFWDLLKKTAARDDFSTHPKIYFQKMFEVLVRDRTLEVFFAQYQHRLVAAAVFCFFGAYAYYLHGASDYQYRALMAPYFLQWQGIDEAKKRNCRFYDFWGIDEKWPGVTRFKTGFGGQKITYPGAFDLIFRPGWYSVYNIAKKLF